MGISDRDYARAPRGPVSPGRSFPGVIGRLSVVHWLMIINIAVFVTDAMLMSSGVLLRVDFGDRFIQGYTPKQGNLMIARAPKDPPPGLVFEASIIDPVEKREVGRRLYRWMPPLTAVGHFSTAKGFFGLEVWRLITFQFLHADLMHLIFNMVGLWFFGPIVEERLRSRKRTAAYYLVCGVFGAVLYLLLNVLGFLTGAAVPGFLRVDLYTPLVGASAGVFGVLMAAARVANPLDRMLVFFVLPLRIRTGAYLLFLGALLNLLVAGHNQGGDAAHVGGAVAGFFFIRNMHLLRDFFEIFGPGKSKGRPRFALGRSLEAEVDAVLEKANRHGMHTLTDKERQVLQRATDRARAREKA